jgi:hypothetical protein
VEFGGMNDIGYYALLPFAPLIITMFIMIWGTDTHIWIKKKINKFFSKQKRIDRY